MSFPPFHHLFTHAPFFQVQNIDFFFSFFQGIHFLVLKIQKSRKSEFARSRNGLIERKMNLKMFRLFLKSPFFCLMNSKNKLNDLKKNPYLNLQKMGSLLLLLLLLCLRRLIFNLANWQDQKMNSLEN
jgi:hypothetical protein